MKKWWRREYGVIWTEWALLLPGGYVVVYDKTGHAIRKGSYGSRWKAIAALKVKGFRRLKGKSLQDVLLPQID